jgi:S-methylmethionine transporter
LALACWLSFGAFHVQGYNPQPLFHNLYADGLFPTGFKGVFTTMLTVNFAFSGTELIGVTAGEVKDPARTIPKAIHTTLWRLIIFFIGSITVMATLIPWKQAGVDQSPFVLVFKSIGLPFAGDILNFVILTAILSAANSGLYASTRMLWSLAHENTISSLFGKTTRHGVPLLALVASMLGGVLALLSSVVAASTVYLVLVSISGLAVVLVWMAIALSEINFRKSWVLSGRPLSELKFKTPWYPVIPWIAFIASLLSCVLIVFDPTQRTALLYMIPFVLCCYGVYFAKTAIDKRSGGRHGSGADDAEFDGDFAIGGDGAIDIDGGAEANRAVDGGAVAENSEVAAVSAVAEAAEIAGERS